MTSPTYHLMGLMKIATYNVNGVNGRLEGLIRWLQKDRPDIVGLQELKTVNEKFPFEKLESIGYGSVWHGEKGFNGVAILARDTTPVLTRVGLPGPIPDPHSRLYRSGSGRYPDRLSLPPQWQSGRQPQF
ncbi:hypothetical protein AB664_24565 [Brucella anthropi]|uniref:Endonuclease/exonuclease/phosphatase domain-containing protein n=1 Tax=Brucella anthropi TaxID=529 RepID=A0A656Z688_BRUAN|nr:hypothetical protein AB664_24565 [Brucella anthropi]